jgi:hypothetical protein
MNKVISNQQIVTSPAVQTMSYNDTGNLVGKANTILVNADGGNAISPGNFVSFKVPKSGEKALTNIQAMLTLNALSQTSGTYIRFCNAPAINILSRIEIWHNGSILTQENATQIYQDYIRDSKVEDWPLLQKQIGLDTSTSNRNTAAGAVQNLSLSLPNIFGLFAQPFPIFLLKDDLEIRFYFRDVAKFVQCDGTSPVFGGQIQLLVEHTEVPQPLAAFWKNKQVIEFNDYEYIDFASGWSGGSTQYSTNLPGLSGRDIVLLNVIDRTTADLNTNYACTYDSFNAVQSYALRNNSLYATGTEFDLTPAYVNNVLLSSKNFPNMNYLSGVTGYLPICFSADISQELAEHGRRYQGSRRLEGTDISLTLNYASSVGSARTITVSCLSYRRLCLDVKSGKLMQCPM